MPPRRTNAWAKGRQAGYQAGWSEGHHYGVCKSVMERFAEREGILFDVHVAYIEEGLFGLNEGIIEAMSRLVTRFTLCNPNENPVDKIARVRPDLVLVLNGIHMFSPSGADAIRAMGIPIAVWFADDPYYSDRTAAIAPHYDYVFTHELSCVPFYRQLGCRHVQYLPFAVNHSLYRPLPIAAPYRKDVCFIGTGFWNRVRLLDQVAPYLAHKNILIAGSLWGRMRNYRKIAGSVLPFVPPAEAARYYNGAKIVINIHRAHDDKQHNRNSRNLPAMSVNPRTYEIAACGTLQLTDVRSDLANYFTPGHDIETFATPSELVAKIDFYLRHEDQRRTIATRSLHRTLVEHTYRKRLIEILRAMAGNRPIRQPAEAEAGLDRQPEMTRRQTESTSAETEERS